MKQSVYVGIDVGSEKLDVYVDALDSSQVVPNNPKGWEELAQELISLQPERIVLEATGNYEKGVLKALLAKGLPVVRISPDRGKAFARAMGERAKSDPLDAKMLAKYARCLDTQITVLPSENIQWLQNLKRTRDFLAQQIVDTSNVIRTAVDDALKPLMQAHLKTLKDRLKELEGLITREVKKHPVLYAQVQLLCTTPGIGFLSAVALLTEIPEMGSLSPKQITALAGLAPYVQQSGKYKGQARITGGRDRARKSLYMPVVACLRCNEDLKEFYDRLKGAGKPAKKALAACMRKLLCRLNAMVRDQTPWQKIHTTS
jgi:transposase